MRNYTKTNATATFPPSLTVEILPYTIMKSYTTDKKHALFTVSDTTPMVLAYSDKYSSHGKQSNETNQRQQITTTCTYCGISIHNVNTT